MKSYKGKRPRIVIAFMLFLSLSGLYSLGQNKYPTLSLDGIGEIKTQMKLTDLENLVGKKVYNSMHKGEPFHCVYKKISLDITFTYVNNNAVVAEIYTNSNLSKTSLGISVGDSKLKVFKLYKDYIELYSPAEDGLQPNIAVYHEHDEYDRTITFYLTKDLVKGFKISFHEPTRID